MTDKITQRQFDCLAKAELGTFLERYGFSCASKTSIFYREVADLVFHFILLDRLRNKPRFDVKVFAHSPVLDPDAWEKKFPDNLGIPTGCLSFLHSKTGVGPDQELYFCRTEDGFKRGVQQKLLPAIEGFALPYLDKIVSLESLGKLNLHPFFRENLTAYLSAT